MSLKNTSYFNPTLISGCSLWLDGADPAGNGVIPANGTSITSWVDKSLSGNTCSNASSANSPVLFSSILNGKPVLSFTGPAVLNTTTSQWLDNTVMAFPNTTNTIFALVYNNNSTTKSFTANNYIISGRADALISYSSYSGNNFATFVGSGSGWNDLNTNTPSQNMNGVWAITGMSKNSSTLTPYYNGVALNTKSGTMASTTGFIIGDAPSGYRGQCWNGYMAEIIMFPTVLENTQRQQIEGYLAWKWGVVSSLPASHPYALTPSFGLPSLLPNAPAKTTLTYANHPVIAAGGCILWLDGTDPLGTGIQPADGSTISTWVNKSGSAYVMSTAGGTLTYSLSTKSIIFNGSSYYSSPITNQVYTIFFVFNITANSPLFARNLISTNDGFFPNYSGTTFLCQSDSQWYTQTSTFTASTTYIVSVQYDSLNNIYMWQNGALTPTISTTKTGTITANQLSIGYKANGGVYTNGNEYEIIMFNSAISTSQRQTIEGYLAQKWGLTAGLPAGHPYKSTFPLYLSPVTGVRLLANKRWSPLTPGGCGLWLDASDTNTLFQDSAGTIAVTGGGQSIGLWKDKSGAGHDFSQTSSGNRVTYDTSTKGAIQLSSPTYLQASAASLGTVSTSANLTIIMTASTGPSSSWQIILAQWFTGSSRFHLSFQSGTNLTPTLYSASSGSELPYPMSGTMAYNRTYTIGFIANSTALYMSFMGTSNTTTMAAALSTNPSSALTIADSRNANLTDGKIQEIIIYPSAISTTAFQQAEGYMAWKWGLKDSLPSSHPYKLFPPSP